MKYSIVLLFTLIVCFSTKILAKTRLKQKSEQVVQAAYKVKSLRTIAKCLSEGKFVIIKLPLNRVDDGKLPNKLADGMLTTAGQSKVVDENDWKKVLNKVCLSKPNLINDIKKDADTINQCFPKAKRLGGVKIVTFANDLYKSVCSAVPKLATSKLAKIIKGRKANP